MLLILKIKIKMISKNIKINNNKKMIIGYFFGVLWLFTQLLTCLCMFFICFANYLGMTSLNFLKI